MAKFSPKIRKFIAEYIQHGNGTKAATRAGYSERSAEVQASRLLRKAKVSAEIEKRLEAILEKSTVTKERLMKEMEIMALANITDFENAGNDLSTLPPHQSRAITKLRRRESTTTDAKTGDKTVVVTVDVELDKSKAQMGLAKLKGWAVEKVEHEAGESLRDLIRESYQEPEGEK